MSNSQIVKQSSVGSGNRRWASGHQFFQACVGENVILLVIRPQEAVAALQALVQAYLDYYGAIADFNRAQFRLYRAVGNPRHVPAESLSRKACP